MADHSQIDVWRLNPDDAYILEGDDTVRDLLKQLGIPNLFAGASEFDAMHALVAFDNHPTHWLVIHLWQGVPDYSPNHKIHDLVGNPSPNGLLFQATPKSSASRAKMEIKLAAELRAMEANQPFAFQHLPSRK